MIRDLTDLELRYVDQDQLANRVRALQAERAERADELQGAQDRITELELQLAQARGEA